MTCGIYKLNELKDYKYVVILSRYNNRILLSQHEKRTTWETQGGHIEENETELEAAKRELYEESGAVEFTITPIFDYRAGDEVSAANGMVFFADIKKLEDIPLSEMRAVKLFDILPDNLTYPDITPALFAYAKEYFLN